MSDASTYHDAIRSHLAATALPLTPQHQAAIDDRNSLNRAVELERRRAATPVTYGPTAAVFLAARQALSDAQAAGDPAYAARILMAAAAQCARHDRAWCLERPPLGVKAERREAA